MLAQSTTTPAQANEATSYTAKVAMADVIERTRNAKPCLAHAVAHQDGDISHLKGKRLERVLRERAEAFEGLVRHPALHPDDFTYKARELARLIRPDASIYPGLAGQWAGDVTLPEQDRLVASLYLDCVLASHMRDGIPSTIYASEHKPAEPPVGAVARLYPEWLAALAASGDERPGFLEATDRFSELEEQIEATPCRTVQDATAKLKVLLNVYEDGGIVLNHGHLIGQLKDTIAGLDEDARRREWIAAGAIIGREAVKEHWLKAEERAAWDAVVARREQLIAEYNEYAERENAGPDQALEDALNKAEAAFYITPAPDFAAVLAKLGENLGIQDPDHSAIDSSETVDELIDRLAATGDIGERCQAQIYRDIQRLAGLSPSAALVPTAPQNPLLIAAE